MPSKLMVIVPSKSAPAWFNEFLSLAKGTRREIEIFQLDTKGIEKGYTFIQRLLHRFFGYSQVDYLAKKELDGFNVKNLSTLIDSNPVEAEINLIDFTLSSEARKWSLRKKNVTFWFFSKLAWSPGDKDTTYFCWKNQKSGSLLQIFKEETGKVSLMDSILSPAGQLSLFDYRRAYSALPGRLIQLITGKAITRESKTDLESLGNKGGITKNVFSTLSQKFLVKLSPAKWVLLYRKKHGEEWKELKAQGKVELADPFFHEEKNGTAIFAEEISQDGFGRIVAFPEDDPEKRVKLFSHSFHMSYPFLFKDNGSLYMIPEAAESNALSLYKCKNYPYQWDFVSVILENIQIVDASVVLWKGRYWMFGNTKSYASTFNEELSIFFADSLFGPWKPHAANPIYLDSRFSRPGGDFQFVNNNLFRFVQDCSWEYGEKIHKMEIKVLSENDFSEKWIERVDLKIQGKFFANHTLNQSEKTGRMITDVYKKN